MKGQRKMKAAPEGLYDGVLMFRDGSERRPPAARLGGIWRTPNYALSYLFTARLALERAAETGHVDAVTLPVAYLQRHAFELALKLVIDLAYEVVTGTHRIQRIKAEGDAKEVSTHVAARTHRLCCLVAELRGVLLASGREGPIDQLNRIAEALIQVEDKDRERLRYQRIGKKNSPEVSLPEERLFRVGEMQAKLEKTFEQHFAFRSNAADLDCNTWNLLETLIFECEANLQQLLKLGFEP